MTGTAGSSLRDCTILVATYNRPGLLARQLAYLSQGPLFGPVVVLDSSEASAAVVNASCAGRYGFDYRLFSGDTAVFAKFSQGFDSVGTPFAILLPDDDFVWLEALPRLLTVLREDKHVGVAHGLYFEFHAQGTSLHATEIIQGLGEHMQVTASERVLSLMSQYEALTYALYRTPVAQHAFALAKDQDSILAQELLGATVAAAIAKVRRIPFVTHGRRAGSTLGYRRWHPLEWAAVDPKGMFEAYRAYREALLAIVSQKELDAVPTDLGRRIDLAHLAYLSRYLSPEVLVSAGHMLASSSQEARIAEVAWDVWAGVHGYSWAKPFRKGGAASRWLRGKIRASGLRYAAFAARERLRKADEIAKSIDVRFHRKLTDSIDSLGLQSDFEVDRLPLAHALRRLETPSGTSAE